MPTYVYECQVHGENDYIASFAPHEPRQKRQCNTVLSRQYIPIDNGDRLIIDNKCKEMATFVLKPVAGIMVKRDWNEKANEAQRDPYTQSKTQLQNEHNRARDLGNNPGKITEEAIQVGAKAIEAQKTKPQVSDGVKAMRAAKRFKKAAKKSG